MNYIKSNLENIKIGFSGEIQLSVPTSTETTWKKCLVNDLVSSRFILCTVKYQFLSLSVSKSKSYHNRWGIGIIMAGRWNTHTLDPLIEKFVQFLFRKGDEQKTIILPKKRGTFVAIFAFILAHKSPLPAPPTRTKNPEFPSFGLEILDFWENGTPLLEN